MTPPRLILEINTRLWLRMLGGGSPTSLRAVPDEVLDQWARAGFDAVWLMGVWRPSSISLKIALEHPGLRADFSRILPEWTPQDVIGSPYAVAGYEVPVEWGGEEALADLRARMKRQGLRLILDFVPNHTARDHPWVFDHPEWYVKLTEEFLAKNPEHGFRTVTASGEAIIAHGKDPYFLPWTDTAQLNYRHPQLRRAQRELLHRLAGLCDGVRCDMAMLILPEVFEKVWPQRSEAVPEFWEANIRAIKAAHPEFCFIAETYWGLDRALNERGLDLTYDKELLDYIATDVLLTKEQFDLPIQEHRRRVRFLENHDEPRIASRLPHNKHFAAATWLAMLPSSLLIYNGQMDGFKTKSPVQLRRDPAEAVDPVVREFYRKLLEISRREVIRKGEWRIPGCRPAWIGNDTHRFVLAQAYDLDNEHLRVYVNWSDQRSQCWSDVHLSGLLDHEVVLRDLLGPKKFVRQGTELMMRGLYLDLDPWEVEVFACEVREVR